MNPIEPRSGKPPSVIAGCLQTVGGGLTVLAGMLVGGGLGGVIGMARGNRFAEQVLSGIALGAIAGLMRATGYRYSWGLAVGALLGWTLGSWWDPFFMALVIAIPGGWLGARVQKKLQGAPPEEAAQAPSPRVTMRPVLAALVGMVAGGVIGAVTGAWLCMVIVFGAWLPSQLPRTIDQGALAIHFLGLVGLVMGAATGARCLYVWTARREVRRQKQEEVIGEYQQWRQQHPRPEEADQPEPPDYEPRS